MVIFLVILAFMVGLVIMAAFLAEGNVMVEWFRRKFFGNGWHVEDVVIRRNPNFTYNIVLGYRDGDSERTRIYEYWIGDKFVCLKPEDFIGMKEFVGMRVDNLGWPPASIFG